MKVNTKHFGEIEIEEKGIIDFHEGIPGFENAKKFILLGSSDENSYFRWLQSVDNPELAFVIINPFLVKKDYDFIVSSSIMNELDIKHMEDMEVYSIVVVPEDTSKISMNLKAPIIINVKNKKGAQLVLDTDMYSVRHYIIEELRRQEDTVNACSDTEKRPVYSNK